MIDQILPSVPLPVDNGRFGHMKALINPSNDITTTVATSALPLDTNGRTERICISLSAFRLRLEVLPVITGDAVSDQGSRRLELSVSSNIFALQLLDVL